MIVIRLSPQEMNHFAARGIVRTKSAMTVGGEVWVMLDGQTVCGPFRVGHISSGGNALLQASPHMRLGRVSGEADSYLNRMDGSMVVFQECAHSPVTSSWTLDGMLRAAFESKGRVSLCLGPDHASLASYVCGELGREHIRHEVKRNSMCIEIAIKDAQKVREVFARDIRPEEYPLPFLLGYISMFTFCGRQYSNTDLAYNRHVLSVLQDDVDEGIVGSPLLLTARMYNSLYLCPSFGHLDPIRLIIDDTAEPVAEDRGRVAFEGNPIVEGVRRAAVPELIHSMFRHLGLDPGPMRDIGGGVLAVDVGLTMIGDHAATRTEALVAPHPAVGNCGFDHDFIFTYSEDGIRLVRRDPEKPDDNRSFTLAHNGFFEAEPRLCEYYDTMVRRMW